MYIDMSQIVCCPVVEFYELHAFYTVDFAG